ncbi:MAG: hypothetical protein NC410_10100 [Oscillibacter sp.]|nr:hypothetical protein [Oscillibacter sp.]
MMNEAALLGKTVTYPKSYCPEILVKVPRRLNREIYGIDTPETLFCGYDSWHAYEASFITANGLPVSGVLKIVYPASSQFLVESKSLKLYLGSMNMTPFGNTPREGITLFTERIRQDLNRLLETRTEICFYQEPPAAYPFDFDGYEILENRPETEQAHFNIYQEHPAYLTENSRESDEELKAGSHLLKSNCKITTQPDWGSIYIRMKARRLPDKLSLLKYIVSIRNENHFHEEICEMVFKRLTDAYQPEILSVACLYTRRGGIDICPVRANQPQYLPHYLPRAETLTARTFRQ